MGSFEQTRESLETARTALEAETLEVLRVSKRLNDNLVEAVKRIWRQLLFIWAVMLALAISYLVILGYSPTATNLANKANMTQQNFGEQIATAMPPQAVPVPAIPESGKVLKLLNQLRDAQYKKDITLFLKAYSPTFPDLGLKREQILKIWRRYDYVDLQFQVNDLEQKDATAISGIITWTIKIIDRKDDEVKTVSKAYRVDFSKESGEWLIQKLEIVGYKET